MEDGLVHVPTLIELYKETPKLADRVEVETGGKKKVRHVFYRATPEGDQRIKDAMRHNGEYLRTHPEARKERESEVLRKARENL